MRVRVHDSLGSADRRTKYTAKNTSPADNSNENRNSQPECTPLRQSRAVDKVEGQCMSCEPPEYSSGRATLASEAHTPRLDNAPSLFILYSPQHHFCTSMCDSVSGERQAVSGRRRMCRQLETRPRISGLAAPLFLSFPTSRPGRPYNVGQCCNIGASTVRALSA